MAARGRTRWRTASLLLGVLLLAAALSPPVDAWADDDFRGHMAQHLLLGMYAPLFLVLGAPVSLALRYSPRAVGRRIGRLLRSGPVRWLTNPVTALVLSAGGTVLVYATPLYAASTQDETLHMLVHAHFLLAGCLFAWAVAGPDPAPHRAPVMTRLVVLGVAIAVHASLAQVMYAGFLDLPAEPSQIRGGADLMYYGGDIGELLLALAVLVTWRPARRLRTGREPLADDGHSPLTVNPN
ncbi:cytochrome c oxidase assembly protein [Actinomadura gamaensis]|uniref:Cytochrome c oxidase assembly protein n=1 Tax=Actinomadura gamaensis TaxID=1763541 RepID=A0ABV9TST9_9ACTN